MTRTTPVSARRARQASTVLAAWIAAIAVFAGTMGIAQDAARPDDLVERGRVLYLEHHCGACHALSTTGSQGFFGPAHHAMGVIAAARIADPHYLGAAETAEAYLRESIVAPHTYVVPGYAFTRHPMPAYDLPDEDLDALVAFLMDQDGSGSASP